MGRIVFKDLFDYLDVELGQNYCDHTLRSTKVFLIEKGISSPSVIIEWLSENGAYCDCEVLGNIEEKFEYINMTYEESSKPIIQHLKFNI